MIRAVASTVLPETSNLDDTGWSELDRIVIDCANWTSDEGIFAAGDVTNVIAEQVLIAVGEGAKAALTAYEYLLQMPE